MSANAAPSSVDPEEVEYYTRLAGTWWDQSGPFWPLHRLNALRSEYIRAELCRVFERDARAADPLRGLEILDIGCGGGILSETMARLGANVHGVDVVERNIEVAKHHVRDANLPVCYEQTSAEALAARGARYDVVLNMEVVEHVANLPGFMHACAALVKPEGLMVVATINRTPLSFLFAIVGAEYILRWLPRGTHRWSQFPTPIELAQLLNDDGFSVTARTGVKVNPFTRRFTLNRRLNVNYMLVARPNSSS